MIKERLKPDYSLIITVFILVVFGLIMLTSASSVVGYSQYLDSYFFLKHQLIVGFLPGLFLFFLLSRISYKVWQKYAGILLLVSVVLLFLVLLPGIGIVRNNARSWIGFGEFSFQPAEITKLILIIFLSAWFAKSKEHIKSFFRSLLPFLILLGVIVGLIALQPDIGTMVIIIIIAVGIYFVAGLKWSHLCWLILAGGGLFTLLIKIDPDNRRLNRIIAFINPAIDPLGIGYHINQALLAVGSGGIFGLGFGHSRQKFEYLPEVYGDSIFAIVAEELGFIFAVFLLLLFLYFIFKILKLAKNQNDDFAKFFCVGFAVWIGVQTLFNVGAMVGILPLTGVPMPFVSYGGTALLSLLAGCGILINISKSKN